MRKKRWLSLAAVTIFAGTSALVPSGVAHGSGSWNGCGSGAGCMFKGADLLKQPPSPSWYEYVYDCYWLSNQTGSRYVYNNQTGYATMTLWTKYGCTGTPTIIAAGSGKWVDIGPIYSISLAPLLRLRPDPGQPWPTVRVELSEADRIWQKNQRRNWRERKTPNALPRDVMSAAGLRAPR
jgi:hypothetical protein